MSIKLKLSKKVREAKELSLPLLALESTIIAHGMPYPKNLEFATEAESICENLGVVPATIAVLGGEICVGLESFELEKISNSKRIQKVSSRELGLATSLGWDGATTVSSTMRIARNNNIEVFSTGGIGGVHQQADQTFDISQDILALSQVSMLVVSSGAKSVLDLAKTLELLETFGVSVVGYKTNSFPSFYSRSSGLGKINRVDSHKEIVEVFINNQLLELPCSTLVSNPVPVEDEIPPTKIDSIIKKALIALKKNQITGKAVTPFLLDAILKETKGKSLETNISLALNNVKLGAEIAKELNTKRKRPGSRFQ
tara:strand:+ start:416 stop:1354 length:939 start_codon:yes stop_codon:yes gene_type:complete